MEDFGEFVHRAPWECTLAKEEKGKCKLGKVPKSDQEYFEILCLCILQAGLNWRMIRENWKNLRKGFYSFDFNRLAYLKQDTLFKNSYVIKNIRKIRAIIENAKEFKRIRKEYGSFQNFLASLKGVKDKEVLKILTKRFKHFGEYTSEYYLHSVGYWKK